MDRYLPAVGQQVGEASGAHQMTHGTLQANTRERMARRREKKKQQLVNKARVSQAVRRFLLLGVRKFWVTLFKDTSPKKTFSLGSNREKFVSIFTSSYDRTRTEQKLTKITQPVRGKEKRKKKEK